MQSFFDVEEERNTTNDDVVTGMSNPENNTEIVTEIANGVSIGTIESLSVAYVSGSIARKILAKSNCTKCKDILSSDSSLPCNQYIALKELSDDQTRLTYPSEELVTTVGHGMTLIEQVLPNRLQDTGLRRKFAITLNEQLDFAWLNCDSHFSTVKHCIVQAVCCISIPWYCKRLVRDLRSRKFSRRARRKVRILQHQ